MDGSNKENRENPSWWVSIREHFPLKAFIVGGLIPIIVYYVFYQYSKPLIGALIAASWGVVVVLVTHFVFRKINLFAILSIPLTLIEIIGTIITFNPDFDLATSAIDHLLWSLAFLVSLTFSRPLILILAEAMGSIPNSAEMKDFRKTKEFKSAWLLLTSIWAWAYLLSAVVLIVTQILMPLEFFLIVRAVLNMPLLAVLIAISFWFPEWYWNRIGL